MWNALYVSYVQTKVTFRFKLTKGDKRLETR